MRLQMCVCMFRTRLQMCVCAYTVDKRGDGAHVVHHGKVDELLVHKVGVCDCSGVVVDIEIGFVLEQPRLAVVRTLLREYHLNDLHI